jgi:3-deoxy-D-manno-octulosonic-acid transferase
VYRQIARLAHRVLPLAGGKLAEGMAGRRGATDRWLAWAAALPAARSLVWVHAASVGEWLAAGPVVRRLKAARPNLTIALTYSSPSLARWPSPVDVDRADYVPPDEPAPMQAVYAALRPRVVLVARGDLWPELLAAAPPGLAAAPAPPRSLRSHHLRRHGHATGR